MNTVGGIHEMGFGEYMRIYPSSLLELFQAGLRRRSKSKGDPREKPFRYKMKRILVRRTYQGVGLAAGGLTIGKYDGIVTVHSSTYMFASNGCVHRLVFRASQDIIKMEVLSGFPALGIELEILLRGLPNRGNIGRPYPAIPALTVNIYGQEKRY